MRTGQEVKQLGTQLVNYLLANGDVQDINIVNLENYVNTFSIQVSGEVNNVELRGGICIEKSCEATLSLGMITVDHNCESEDFEMLERLNKETAAELKRIINELENHK